MRREAWSDRETPNACSTWRQFFSPHSDLMVVSPTIPSISPVLYPSSQSKGDERPVVVILPACLQLEPLREQIITYPNNHPQHNTDR